MKMSHLIAGLFLGSLMLTGAQATETAGSLRREIRQETREIRQDRREVRRDRRELRRDLIQGASAGEIRGDRREIRRDRRELRRDMRQRRTLLRQRV